MKLFRRRTWFLVTGSLFAALLITLFVHSFVLSVNAVDPSYTIRILEITDPTSTASLALDANDPYPKSELDHLQGLTNVKIDTMTMKRFVSLRDHWDGKYDAVYIGNGAFSKKLVNSKGTSTQDQRKAAHKTIHVENDLTRLKAQEITDYYINKGLNVILREETLIGQNRSGTEGVLYETFNPYRTSNRPNVIFLKNLNELNTLTAAIKDGSWSKLASLKQRPRLTITNKPEHYSDKRSTVYRSGDTLEFPVKIDNISGTTPVRIKLYMNVDSSLPVTEDTAVATKEITSRADTLSYTLPSTFSGPLYWRMEVSTLTGLKDFDTGNILYEGVKREIKVLQIMPAGKTESDLLNTKNMKASYLKNPDYYELIITPHDMAWFNNYIAAHASDSDKTSGLNGNFDMVVFGFLDMYDRAATPMLSEAAAQAVKAFAEETKQSLMLTHDTIFQEANAPYVESANNLNYWSYYFHDMVGQALPRTYLGGNAIYPSTKVVPVNQGLMTQYPFNLNKDGDESNRYTVATTHDQFFPLNLERADVIPWYNISGSERDTDDSYNHFYTYSVGNITFSGTGHTSKGFPDWEQKLFVNTMYRAFIGANHAPKITVFTPQDMSTKPSYHDKLTVSYSATDLDLKDKELTTEITIRKRVGDKKNGTYVEVDDMKEKTVLSGETVTHTFNNPLHENGELQIEITAKDKQGALDSRIITVNVEKVQANVSISRSLSKEKVERGEALTITYTVRPNAIPALSADTALQGAEKPVISDVQYSEVFPAKLKFSDLSAGGFIQNGDMDSGYTLTKNLGNFTYHLSPDGLTYVPDLAEGITFTVTAIATEKADYNLNNSELSYVDLHSQQEDLATATPGTTATASSTATPAPPLSQTPAPTQVVRVAPLGLAKDFSLFIRGNINRTGGIEGTIAAGGDVTTSGSGIASAFTGDPHTLDALVVGGNLNFSNDSVNGNVVVGGTSTIASNVSIKGELKQGNPVDFAAEFKFLQEQSDALAALPDNGQSTRYNWGETLLKGTNATNVFTIDGQSITNTVGIDVPKGSTVILNVTGANAVLQNTSFVFCSSNRTIDDYKYSMDSCKGADKYTNSELELQRTKVIYNFYNKTNGTIDTATRLKINSIDIEGTVLAPRASIEFNNGRVYGTLIGASLDGGGTPMNVKFTGETGLPSPPTPVVTTAPTATPTPTVVTTPSPTPAPVPARITLHFAELSFTAYVRMTGLTLEGSTIRINTSLNMDLLKKIIPDDASTPTLTWESLNQEVATISGTGVVWGASPGTASIRLTAVDAAGQIFTANADIIVMAPQLNISGPASAYVGDTADYLASYVTVDDTVHQYEWKIKEGSNTAGVTLTVDPAYPLNDHASLVARNPGQVTLVAIARTKEFQEGTSPEERTVTFTNRPNPVRKITISGPNSVNVGGQITLRIIEAPVNADPAEYHWSLEADGLNYATIIHEPDTKSIQLTGVTITAPNKPVVVRASLLGAPAGDPVDDTFEVTVGTRLTDLKLIDSIDIGVGKENSRDLFDVHYLTLFPEEITLSDVEGKLEWSSSNLAVVTVSSNGKITGLIKGSAKVTVMYKDNPSIKSSIKVNVSNEDRY
ncbi:DUF5057 domain-containing protein [Paenibacillus tritici]|uniref:DUF5057 domain-containing protein n=1 Tax=Paenibacillus tritici TaxID=1873425 RepID=UPI001BA67761|nr:DUF5057 domain-containing protein [Paenibacillus tritici]QUL54527.1 DUF5057 domain-containing protein [Paenibacillus tritici]